MKNEKVDKKIALKSLNLIHWKMYSNKNNDRHSNVK